MAKLVSLTSAQSAVRASVARALAEALICGFDNAAEEGHTLNQLQSIDIATMHIMAYDNAIKTCEVLETEVEVMLPFRQGRI